MMTAKEAYLMTITGEEDIEKVKMMIEFYQNYIANFIKKQAKKGKFKCGFRFASTIPNLFLAEWLKEFGYKVNVTECSNDEVEISVSWENCK
jgi:phosphomannomutase